MGQRHGILSSIFKLANITFAIISINAPQNHDTSLCIIYCNKIWTKYFILIDTCCQKLRKSMGEEEWQLHITIHDEGDSLIT